MTYICTNCNFKFKLKSESSEHPKRCPYCSKENTVISDDEGMIKDVEDLLK